MDYNSNRYKNNVPFPKKTDFTKYNYYHNGKPVCLNVSYETATKYQEQRNNEGVIEKIVDREKYEKAYQEYRNGEFEAEQRWRDDLEKEYGISFENPVYEKILEYAWEQSHSDGLHNVEITFAELIELFHDVLKIHEREKNISTIKIKYKRDDIISFNPFNDVEKLKQAKVKSVEISYNFISKPLITYRVKDEKTYWFIEENSIIKQL